MGATKVTYTIGDNIAALVVAVAFGLVGAAICQFINDGLHLPQKFFKGFTIKAPSRGYFKLPTLLGMIIFSLIARNYFGDFMEAFPDDWGQWIR